MTLGPGIMSLIGINSSEKLWVPLCELLPLLIFFPPANSVTSYSPIPFALGIGLLYAGTVFPVLAPLPPSLAGQALAFLVFVRNFGNVLGITVGKLQFFLLALFPSLYFALFVGEWMLTRYFPQARLHLRTSSQITCLPSPPRSSREAWLARTARFLISKICEYLFCLALPLHIIRLLYLRHPSAPSTCATQACLTTFPSPNVNPMLMHVQSTGPNPCAPKCAPPLHRCSAPSG